MTKQILFKCKKCNMGWNVGWNIISQNKMIYCPLCRKVPPKKEIEKAKKEIMDKEGSQHD